MMISLALDTSQSIGQMLLVEEGVKKDEILESIHWRGFHSELITSKFQELCLKLKRKNKEDRPSINPEIPHLEKIYCVCGPGSFTGCRVAVSFVKVLAYSLNCPVVPLNHLDLLRLNCSDESCYILSCIDARRNSVFASLYKKEKTFFRNKILPIQKLDQFISQEVFVCGEGLKTYEDFIPDRMRDYLIQKPQWEKGDLKKYFQASLLERRNEKQLSWKELKPLYIKASSAEEKLKGMGRDETFSGPTSKS